jgi:mRNA interferase MazF
MYQFGEVVLLEYPYTDLVGVKMRPAVVLKDTNDGDFIARATSQSKQTEFDVLIEEWEKAGLLKPSIIRVHKLNSLEIKLVKRKMGNLTAKDQNSLSQCLKKLFYDPNEIPY